MSAGRIAELSAEVARLRAENERYAANLDRWEEARAIRAALVAALQAALVYVDPNDPEVRRRAYAALRFAGVDP